MAFTYLPLKCFAWYSCKLFFRDVNVINEQNIPEDGPTIIYGNHNNQFVDGMLLMTTLKRPISFIAAAASCRRLIVGPLIKGTGAIAVERPQDVAKAGKGLIVSINGKAIKGANTQFTKIKIGELLAVKSVGEFRVFQINSDTQLLTDSQTNNFEGSQSYKIIPKLDFNDLYENVWSSLKNGKCIGIYPEGGSHDRNQLLPLKAGICIMALGAMQKYNIPVKIVPCGFNYYNPQKFRSKVIVQFGPAYTIPQQLIDLYKKDKKKAINILLQNLEKVIASLVQMLKAVTTEFKSYNDLSTLFLARELYSHNSTRELTIKQKLELNRRFAKGYQLMMQDQQYREVHERLLKFSEFVQLNGLPIRKQSFFSNIFTDIVRFVFYLEKCLLRAAIALPGLILMGPTTTLITYMTEKQRKRCLKGSKVKLFGNDVVGSYKIMLSSFLLPLTALFHSTALYFILKRYPNLLTHKSNIIICLLLFALQPIYAILFVKAFDSINRSLKKLKYFFLRIFKRNIYNDFNKEKKEIQRIIFKMVQKLGEEVVPDFQRNRIVEKEQMVAMSESQLFIFDEDEYKQE